MTNRQRVSNQMRQVYEETKATMSAAERMEFLLAVGKQQAQELKYRKLSIKENRDKRKEKRTKPSGGDGINPGLRAYLDSKKEQTQ